MTQQKAIIIGAGVAGPIMALQLAKAGYTAEVYESREEENTSEGAFLALTPNGLNILKEFGDIDELKEEYTAGAMRLYNGKGKQIGELKTGYQKDKYGEESFQLKRAALNQFARKAAEGSGIPIHYNKVFVKYTEENEQVTAYFADGTTATGDILIGSDGMFSAVRRQMFPGEVAAKYTGLISTGGYAHIPQLFKPLDSIKMTFGEKGFFAYTVSNKGEVWWFNNYHREQEPKPHELNDLKDEIKRHLLELHRADDPLFSAIIRASDEVIAYPIYDVPKLEKWHKGRVCLVGDAAHGVAPHVGQGASLALEDTLVLAMKLKDEFNYKDAFRHFQQERQERVEKIIKSARKVGKAKRPNALAVWFRDKLLRYFIQQELKKLDWVYGWKYATAPVVSSRVLFKMFLV